MFIFSCYATNMPIGITVCSCVCVVHSCDHRSNNACESFHAAIKQHYFPDITSRFISTLPLHVMMPKYIMILQLYAAQLSRSGAIGADALGAAYNRWEPLDQASAFILYAICNRFEVWPDCVSELEKCCFPKPEQYGQNPARKWVDDIRSFVPSATTELPYGGAFQRCFLYCCEIYLIICML